LSVGAGVTLSVTPRRVSSRGTIRFNGRLRGGPGRAGTQVVIYALGGARERIPVATVRASVEGKFRYRYPYATGSSGTATVRIR
jgi:hypothetical protein